MPAAGAISVPVQLPVTAAQVYYFRLASFTGTVATAHLTVEAYRLWRWRRRRRILILDDVPGYPLAVIDSTTGAVTSSLLGFRPAKPRRKGTTAALWWRRGPPSLRRDDDDHPRLQPDVQPLFEVTVDPTDFQHAYLSSNRTTDTYVML